jgi:protein phosphatase
VVLVGAAGAGKSTLAARLFPADQILASDTLRGVISGDESNQGVTRAAFALLDRLLDRRLRDGLTTVVDATNVTRAARRALVQRAERHRVPAIGIVLDLEPSLVLARNATRTGSPVPVAAVERQLASLARSVAADALLVEGFAAIHLVRTPDEVAGLRIGAAAPPAPNPAIERRMLPDEPPG